MGVLIAILIIASVGVAYAAVSWSITLEGEVIEPQSSDLKVTYENGTEVHTLDFGQMEQGKTYYENVIVCNTGNSSLELSLILPNHADYVGSNAWVRWNREDYVLSAGDNVTATIEWEISSTCDTGSIGGSSIGIEGT